MKKNSIIIFILILSGLIQLNAQNITGSGTAVSPYILYNLQDIDSIRYIGLNKYYEIGNNIDGSLASIATINNFTGYLDGKGYWVYNFSLSGDGLFSTTGHAVIKNLYLKKINKINSGTIEGITAGILGCTEASSTSLFENIWIDSSLIRYTRSSGISSNAFIGGMFARTYYDTLKLCRVTNTTCSLSVGDAYWVYAGILIGLPGSTKIDQCYTTGTVYVNSTSHSGNTSVGGFIGNIASSTISNSYFMGSVTATGASTEGGFTKNSLTGSVNNCYTVISNTMTSAFAVANDLNLSSCYFDSSLVSVAQSSGTGTPANKRSSSEMKTQSTYTGWDFTNIWGIRSDFNGGYPYLKNIQSPPASPEWPKVFLFKH